MQCARGGSRQGCASVVQRKYEIKGRLGLMRWVRQFGIGRHGKIIRVEKAHEVNKTGPAHCRAPAHLNSYNLQRKEMILSIMGKQTVLAGVVWILIRSAACAQSGGSPEYHLEAVPTGCIRAHLTYTLLTPNMQAQEWCLFAPAPPEGIGQGQVGIAGATINGVSVRAESCFEGGPLRRAVLRLRGDARVGDRQRCVAEITYTTTLFSRRLVFGAPSHPVPLLPEVQRSAYLASSSYFDFDSTIVKNWQSTNGLRRQPGESEVSLARRVLSCMQEQFHYEKINEPKASIVCGARKGECGGLSLLFATVLRAEGVPARVLYGIHTDRTTHSISEFYAVGIGWIPVEVAGVVTYKGPISNFVGRTPGTYLALHADPDLELDTIHFGKKRWPWLNVNGMLNWSFGLGKYEGQITKASWTFENLPLPTMQQRPDVTGRLKTE